MGRLRAHRKTLARVDNVKGGFAEFIVTSRQNPSRKAIESLYSAVTNQKRLSQ
jgi:hypothetical protein